MKDSSKLLIDEYPLQVLPTLACKIGLNSAIILQQVHYWIVIAKKGKDDRKFIDGRWWVYNTYDEWRENFPWWSVPTIKRTVLRLEKLNLLISREMQAENWDHTKWYAVNYELLDDLIDGINLIPSEESDRFHRKDQNGSILNRNTETTPETTQEEDELKATCLEILQSFAVSIFAEYMTWHTLKLRLQDQNIGISGDKEQMTVTGLSDRYGQFSEAEVWSEKYAKSFAQHGLQIVFQE